MNKKIEKVNVQDILELSMVQKGMLFHYLKESDNNLYNVQVSLNILGKLNIEVLREAFRSVQLENEALRSVFSWEVASKPLQIILKNNPLDLVYQDISQMNEADIQAAVEQYTARDREERFDLSDLPVRVRVIKTAEDAYVFSITHHHILYDGWSGAILLKEFFYCYSQLIAGQQPFFDQKPTFKEVSAALQKNSAAADKAPFWKNYLKGYEITPFINGAPAAENTSEVQKLRLTMPNGKMKTFAGKHKVTQAALIYAAYGILMAKYSNVADVIFGITVAGRDATIRGNDKVIGNFINTLPLRIPSLENQSLLDIVNEVNKDLIDRNEYNNTSYSEIKQLLNINPADDLFDSVLVIENYPIDEEVINISKDFSVTLRGDYEHPGIPLIIKVFLKEQLEIELVYNKKNVDPDYVKSLGGHFLKIINNIVDAPAQPLHQLGLLSEQEEQSFLYTFNNTGKTLPEEETVLSLFEKQAALHPNNIAQSCNGRSLTYAALNDKANKVALYLTEALSVQPGDTVGVMMDREEQLVPFILGILKAGAVYLPIDPVYPVQRIHGILEDSGMKVLITREKHRDAAKNKPVTILDIDKDLAAIEALAPVASARKISGDSLAYIIYTSGSTGKPKGVMIEHRSLLNYITWGAETYVRGDVMTFPLYTSISFDLTITSVFLPLITGNEILVYGDDEQLPAIEQVLQDNKANIVKCTPSHLKILKDSPLLRPAHENSIKRFIVGGENLETQLAKEVYDKLGSAVEIYNEYGPTEATVGCMIYLFDPKETSASVPIGIPINNTQIYILDRCMKPLPAGVSGELYIAGDGLARGYHGRKELTQQKFIDNPFIAGKKMYKTGDVATRLADGNIVYKGRIDNQVKIRGYRIELREIEENIRTYKEEPIRKPVIEEKFESFADDTVIRCKNCVLTSNYPGVTFNEEGICNVCEDYFSKKDFLNTYFREENELVSFFKNKKPSPNKEYDCLLLFSGGKDSTYTLYKLMEMGLRVLTFTFDNGFISKAAFQNINSTAEKFKIKSLIRTSSEINKVLLESLRSKHNACTGCWNTINSLGIQVAQEFGIDTIVSGLSRGQIIEMRLEGLLEAGIMDEGEINDNLQLFRKSFHSKDNVFFSLLKSNIDVEFLSNINFVDYFRYDNVNTDGVKDFLLSRGWVQPKDTGMCSTNCVINDVGIYTHWKKKGYHFYEAPLGWDTRLKVIDRQKTIDELSDSFNVKKIDSILSKIGYYDPIRIEDIVVTVKEDGDGNKYTVAYYTSNGTVDKEKLREHVKRLLPVYMVPNHFVQLFEMPLTSNGKVDVKALPEPDIRHVEDYVAPTTKMEKLLADVWSKVLKTGNISITDNFFSLGGDSIKSIQISSRMHALGYKLPVKDILDQPTIKKLAPKVKALTVVADQSPVTGEVRLSPIQQWFISEAQTDRHHFNQSVLLQFANDVSESIIKAVFGKLLEHHDALRMTFRQQDNMLIQWNNDVHVPVALTVYDLKKESDPESTIKSLSNEIQSGINLENGPLLKLGLFHTKAGSQLLIAIHHLVVDGVSWRILLEDIDTLYKQALKNEPFALPLKTDSYKSWSDAFNSYAESDTFRQARSYWQTALAGSVQQIKRDMPAGNNYFRDQKGCTFKLEKEQTRKLLAKAHASFNTQINDILLVALLLSIKKQFGHKAVLIDLEGHGRDGLSQQVNVSRTVGWFTSIYPVLLKQEGEQLSDLIRHIKETLRNVPNKGIDFLLQKYGNIQGTAERYNSNQESRISFNYLGQTDTLSSNGAFTVSHEAKGNEISGNMMQQYDWNIIGQVAGGQLEMNLMYSDKQYNGQTITALMQCYKECLLEVIDYCCTYGKVLLTPSDLSYKGLSVQQLDELQRKYAIEDIYPLSPMQEGLLFHSLVDPESHSYFEQRTLGLKGWLNITDIEKSLNDLMARYDILRTIFLHTGYERPVQVVLKERKIDFSYIDVREECRQYTREEVIRSWQGKERAKPFDLTKDVLMRVTVLQTDEGEYEFIFSYHHILMDGWCMSIIWEDFKSLYTKNGLGERISLPPVKKYSTYINWVENRNKQESTEYWKRYLDQFETPVSLPKKESVLKTKTYDLSSQELILDEDQTKSLYRISQEYGITINTIIQSAWGIVLSKYNNARDVVFGSVVSGRPSDIEGVEKMVGLFINTVPVRIKYAAEDTVGDLLKRVQQNALETEPYHYHSLTDIQSLSGWGRELVDHIMMFENFPLQVEAEHTDKGRKGFTLAKVRVFEQTNYDLSVVVTPGDMIRIKFDYNVNTYANDMIKGLQGHLQHIVSQIISSRKTRITAMELMPHTEKQLLLHELDNAAVAYPENKNIIDLFTEQVKRTPNKIAVTCGDETITYEELNRESGKLAALLIEKNVKPDDVVGLLMDRSIQTIVGMLAILKAGGAYLPIDVDYPDDRIAYLISDSGTKVIVTSRESKHQPVFDGSVVFVEDAAGAPDNTAEVPNVNQPHHLCYIIYTSGTTGNPKGVMVEHRNVVRLLFNDQFQFNFTENDVWTMFHSHCFDFSVWEIYGALLFGGKLVVIPKMIARDTRSYLDILKKEGVTVLNQTPSAFYNLIHEEEKLAEKALSIRYVIFGGEALSPAKLKTWHSRYPDVKLINMFGITETTVHVTYKEIGAHEIAHNISNVGKPIPTLSVYILDQYQKPVPKGVIGELYVGGAGVARGYLGKPALTNQKFIKNPFVQGRLYRSGDLARILENGDIEYIGRIDDQVKIRGFRIELGEIESQLAHFDKIKEVVVLVKEKTGDKYLVAYYVAEHEIDAAELGKYLSGKLPDYMVPTHYIHLPALPLTSNGKLDKKALPEPEIKSVAASAKPRNQIQKELVQIWADVLNVEEDKIGVNTNFFDIGGNSLMLVKMADKINRRFNAGITVAQVFTYPVIEMLAGFLTKENEAATMEPALETGFEEMNEAINLLNRI